MQARIGIGDGPVHALARRVWLVAMALAESGRSLVTAPYRPEKHYMRGPGPKAAAKQAKAKAGRRLRDVASGT